MICYIQINLHLLLKQLMTISFKVTVIEEQVLKASTYYVTITF